VKVYTVRTNPIGFGLATIAALAVGGVLFVLGLTLILGLLAAGAVVGTGIMLVRRLTGASRRDRERLEAMMRDAQPGAFGLDPRMEVLPPQPSPRRPDALPTDTRDPREPS
jgi:hypothetical protein